MKPLGDGQYGLKLMPAHIRTAKIKFLLPKIIGPKLKFRISQNMLNSRIKTNG